MHYTNEELDGYIDQIETDRAEYLKNAVPNIVKALRDSPNSYLAFGVYWYHVKDIIQRYATGDDWFQGDFNDRLIMESSDHGSDFRNAVAALVYADSSSYFSASSHSYTKEGEPRNYILEDDDFLFRGDKNGTATESATPTNFNSAVGQPIDNLIDRITSYAPEAIATEAAETNFNSALGKPIGYLVEQVEAFDSANRSADLETFGEDLIATGAYSADQRELYKSAKTVLEIGERPKDVPEDWIVMVAPRPLNEGFGNGKKWRGGEDGSGFHFVAMDPNLSEADKTMNTGFLESNLALHAKVVFYVKPEMAKEVAAMHMAVKLPRFYEKTLASGGFDDAGKVAASMENIFKDKTVAETQAILDEVITKHLDDPGGKAKIIDDFISKHGEVGFKAPFGQGKHVLVHPSSKEKGSWQVSIAGKEGLPLGDTLLDSHRKAVEHVVRSGLGVDMSKAEVSKKKTKAEKPIRIEGKLNPGLKAHFAKNGIPETGTVFENKGRLVTLKSVEPRGDVSDIVMGYTVDGVEKEFPLAGIPAVREEPLSTTRLKEPWQLTKEEYLSPDTKEITIEGEKAQSVERRGRGGAQSIG